MIAITSITIKVQLLVLLFFVNGEDIEVFVLDIVAVVDGVSNGGCGSWW